MSYSQEKNPLSRKVSPLNANNPFKRISPLNMAEKGVKHKEMPEKDLAKHKAKQHRRKGGDPDMEREKREEENRYIMERMHPAVMIPGFFIGFMVIVGCLFKGFMGW